MRWTRRRLDSFCCDFLFLTIPPLLLLYFAFDTTKPIRLSRRLLFWAGCFCVYELCVPACLPALCPALLCYSPHYPTSFFPIRVYSPPPPLLCSLPNMFCPSGYLKASTHPSRPSTEEKRKWAWVGRGGRWFLLYVIEFAVGWFGAQELRSTDAGEREVVKRLDADFLCTDERLGGVRGPFLYHLGTRGRAYVCVCERESSDTDI
ncbi:hypothetical protein K505DRAFT_143663 [Melanomma pulvis-pyrius CBS 109.77]|uniref:Uncharacterized protein n=1 Tax=Melanomma pulvis-pyrius CBS 109.77 TaxID=1314802 RepID=A0A6A6XM82_9PLEO|nr:hypothetical protein K505DRAFT_143663 [Melanomma pulvis-pyrius CBS 109.77]